MNTVYIYIYIAYTDELQICSYRGSYRWKLVPRVYHIILLGIPYCYIYLIKLYKLRTDINKKQLKSYNDEEIGN